MLYDSKARLIIDFQDVFPRIVLAPLVEKVSFSALKSSLQKSDPHLAVDESVIRQISEALERHLVGLTFVEVGHALLTQFSGHRCGGFDGVKESSSSWKDDPFRRLRFRLQCWDGVLLENPKVKFSSF